MLRLINFDYVQEGNDFSSLFRNSTPWVRQAQEIVAGPLIASNFETEFNDEYKTFVAISGNFSHAKPSIGPSNQSSSETLI